MGKHPKQVDETCFPIRFQKESNELGYFMKKDFIKTNLQKYRILRSTDPESFYFKFGQVGLRKLDHNKTAAQSGPPMGEWEFQTKRGEYDWSEIPQRKFYERILYEAHGLTHSGTTLTESTFHQRFWFPHFRSYIVSFIHACSVC